MRRALAFCVSSFFPNILQTSLFVMSCSIVEPSFFQWPGVWSVLFISFGLGLVCCGGKSGVEGKLSEPIKAL